MAQLQKKVEKAEQNMELIQNPVKHVIQQVKDDADKKMVKVAKQMDDVQVEKEMEQQMNEMSQMAQKASEVKNYISKKYIKNKKQAIKRKLCEAADKIITDQANPEHEIITEMQLEDQLQKLNLIKDKEVSQICQLLNAHARQQLNNIKHLTMEQQILELGQDLIQQCIHEHKLKKQKLELQLKEHVDVKKKLDVQKQVLQILEKKHQLKRQQQENEIEQLRISISIREEQKQIQQIMIEKNLHLQIEESNVMTILDKIKEILQLKEWKNSEEEVQKEKSDLKKKLEQAQYLKDRVQQIQHKMQQLQQIKERAQSIKLQALQVKEQAGQLQQQQLKQTQKTRATQLVEQQLLQVMQQARDIQQAKEMQKQIKEIQREAKEVEQQAQQKEWDEYYMKIACLAAQRSKDPSTPVS